MGKYGGRRAVLVKWHIAVLYFVIISARSAASQSCGGYLTSPAQFMSPPNYKSGPACSNQNYGNPWCMSKTFCVSYCNWTIVTDYYKNIQLSFDEFHFPLEQTCCPSHVEVWEGSTRLVGLCGTEKHDPITSTNNTLFIKMAATSTTSGVHFRASWTAGCKHTILEDSSGAISSPKFPRSLQEVGKCKWTVSVQPGNVIEFTFGTIALGRHLDPSRSCDQGNNPVQVVLYDSHTTDESSILGRYCGQGLAGRSSKISTTGNYLTVILDSKDANWGNYQTHGFNASYVSKADDGSTKAQSALFAFGRYADDKSLNTNDEKGECMELGTSADPTSQYGIPLGDSGIPHHTRAQVHANGRVLIHEGTNCDSEPTGYVNVYHTAIDNSKFSSEKGVDYKIYTEKLCKELEQGPTQSSPCQKANQEILKYTGEAFDTRLLLVATWSRVSHSSKAYSGEATFQVAIISDGLTTYALTYYQSNGMKWESQGTPDISVGYGLRSNGVPTFVGMPLSDIEQVLNLDKITGNTGYRGVWLYPLTSTKNSTPEKKCSDWYKRNKILNFMNNYKGLPTCPCEMKFIEQDADWARSPHDEGRVGHTCFRLSKARSRKFFPYSKLCCYGGSMLTVSMPSAGSALAFNPTYPYLANDYEREDKQAYNVCCVQSQRSYCEQFFELRLMSTCDGFKRTRYSWMCCDPHITTLDEKGYAFNGWGEYTMVILSVPGLTFTLQGRTDRPETENGHANGTVFTAFGARENGVKVFVSLDDADKSFLVIYANETDYSLQFRNNPNFLVDTEDFKLSRNNGSLAVSFPSGITIAVSVRINSLGVSVSLPLTFRNQTRGLLGNFNGITDDDFILPDGTALPSNLTERQIFEDFGKMWRVTETNSVMRYGPREGPANYSHPDFTPIFLDEQPSSVRQEAEGVCGSSNLACITDYVATGSAVFALDSKQFKDEADRTNEFAKNAVPQLYGPSQLRLTSGVTTNFTLQGRDLDVGDVLTYYAVDDGNGAVQVHPTTGEVTFTPEVSRPTTLSFYAVDSHGVQSPVIIVPIIICTGCSSHGYCDLTRYFSTEESGYDVQYAVCVCDPAWDGPNCERDKDGCADYPCMEQQTCTDLTPEKQGVNKTGYDCGPCPAGFTKIENSQKCSDIDECADNSTNECDMNCYNRIGSYECSCDAGYRLDNDGHTCWDINECQERTDNCQHICINTVGSYRCQCQEGYVSVDSGVTCTQDNATASLCSNVRCSQGCRGALNPVSGTTPECFCHSGYDLDPTDNTTCMDHNECLDNICPQLCSNYEGGFTCFCDYGFKLSQDRITCEPCPPLHYGPDCELTCTCRGRFEACHPVKGCICQDGWTGNLCMEDVNECLENRTICGNEKVCNNTRGSYKCSCLEGYEEDASGSCHDTDECAPGSTLNNCGPEEQCVNLPGSFYCACPSGYTKINGECTDIDECMNGINSCEQICTNIPGTYNCDCYYGYRLNTDRVSCTHVSEVCAEEGLNCGHGCTFLGNQIQPGCFCRAGYRLSTNQQTCQDINECRENISGCSHTCNNTIGGFHCSCPVGMKLDNNKKTCTDCPSGTYGANCAENCSCGIGSDRCDLKAGCICKLGWRGEKCDDDVNECDELAKQEECRTRNAHCVNYPSGFRCECDDGFEEDTIGICQDINECLENLCDQQCENSPGSYRCLCREGFMINPETGLCKDIDECAILSTNNCTLRCLNIAGSYKCVCNIPGLLLDVDGFSCVATQPCDRTDCPLENGGCSNEECFCNSGYQLTHDNRTCEIAACTKNFYGENCLYQCDCSENTEKCLRDTGECLCKAGWEGRRCDIDIDECMTGQHSCQGDHSLCLNKDGGFDCVCEKGYTMVESVGCISLSRVKVTFRIEGIFVDAAVLTDTTSSTYFMWTRYVSEALTSKLATAVTGFRSVSVLKLRVGSLIADADIVIDETSHIDSLQTLSLALLKMPGDAIIVSGQTGTLSIIVNGAEVNSSWTPCDLYEALRPCSAGMECLVTGRLPECRAVNGGSSPNNAPLIIAVTVTLSVVIIIIVIIVAVVCTVRKKKRAKKEAYGMQNFKHPASGTTVTGENHNLPHLVEIAHTTGQNIPAMTMYDQGVDVLSQNHSFDVGHTYDKLDLHVDQGNNRPPTATS